VLRCIDELIENNSQRIELLEQMAQAVYREWFAEFRYPGHKDAPLVDSDLGPIPEGWDVVSVDEIARVNARTLKASAELGEILYLDISSVSTGHMSEPTPVDFQDAPGRARRQVKHGDVIWSTVRPNRRSYALLIDPPENLIVSTGFAVITPDKVPCSFLYRVLTTDAFVGYLTNRATGAAYPAVTGKVFEEAPVVLPPDELLDLFSVIAEPMDLLVARLQRANLNLRAARGLLLPRLISGEIDVADLNIELGDPAA
jgi:type I restriction enzyme S subunit